VTWSAYGEFLAFAVVLVLIPGPDFAFAWSHALLSLIYLLALTAGLHRARKLLLRRKVRRTLDGATAAALLGFSVRLAAENA
jgi:threonine/homoserine/homoserine lactone efflux protein